MLECLDKLTNSVKDTATKMYTEQKKIIIDGPVPKIKSPETDCFTS